MTAKAMQLYHGSRKRIGVGETVRPGRDGLVYLAASERWADAFAFRDAASTAITAATATFIAAIHDPAATARLNYAETTATGWVHSVSTTGTLIPDDDFLDNLDSVCTAEPVTVSGSQPGRIRSWREFTSVVGPYQKFGDGTAVFNEDGWYQPPQRWLDLGYRRSDFQVLGPWYPYQGVWEIAGQLILVSEFSLHFQKIYEGGLSPMLIQILSKLVTAGAAVPLADASAGYPGRDWWR